MQLIVNQRILDLSVPKIMGILNVTPDSFYDGGKYNNLAVAIDHTAEMIAGGAELIDVGGESTRPGADVVSDEEEVARVVPVVSALAQRFDIFISVNTSKALVMRESTAVGAHLINDIRALSEPGALDAAVTCQLPVCLMHMQGDPCTMQKAPYYHDILAEIDAYFVKQIIRCEIAGIKKDQLLLDPGFGFGKNLIHNYRLLAQIAKFHHFGLPLIVGMSRKSMVGKLMKLSPKNCISGSLACAVIAAMQGVQIIRVHDVKQTVEALRVVEATLRQGKYLYE